MVCFHCELPPVLRVEVTLDEMISISLIDIVVNQT